MVYFVTTTVGIWVNFVLFRHYLTANISQGIKTGFYIGFNLVKLLYEIIIGVVFMLLFIVFNKESEPYQKNKENMGRIACTKILLVLMFILYVINTIIFDAIGPLFIAKIEVNHTHEYDTLL